MYYYINYFFILSIFGHIIESFFYSGGDSGILLGYWTPIYGIGSIIILFIYKFIDKNFKNKFLKTLILFFSCSILLSLIEIIGGYILKWIFNIELWNYTNHKYNIGKYTSIEMSFLWGLSSILLIYFIKPIFDKLINKIPRYISNIFIFIFVIDLIATLIVKK